MAAWVNLEEMQRGKLRDLPIVNVTMSRKGGVITYDVTYTYFAQEELSAYLIRDYPAQPVMKEIYKVKHVDKHSFCYRSPEAYEFYMLLAEKCSWRMMPPSWLGIDATEPTPCELTRAVEYLWENGGGDEI